MALQCSQFPLQVAYASTFNKSQGKTLDQVMVDVRNPVFAHKR
jgi:ATP-dependent exoDNAse (exonuclease V) alpha subunit